MLAIDAGLWFWDTRIHWYVGASGALHGFMAAGTLAHLRRGDLDGWILAIFIVLKLGYEQWSGALPFSDSGVPVVVNAHLYGALGGLIAAAVPEAARATRYNPAPFFAVPSSNRLEMPFAFVFPGQGSQSVGMLAGLCGSRPRRACHVRRSQPACSATTSGSSSQEGPLERLNQTECTQPALLAAGIATLRLWAKRGVVSPPQLSGHSLGEFTALVAAGALDFSTAHRRREVPRPGHAGSRAGRNGRSWRPSSGWRMPRSRRPAARPRRAGSSRPSTTTAPGQVVIAGETAAVQRAIEAAKARGAKRALPLPVSVPSHSSLMKPARRTARQAAGVRRIPGAAGAIHQRRGRRRSRGPGGHSRPLLVRQLASPVRWQDTVRALAGTGVDAAHRVRPRQGAHGSQQAHRRQ